MDRLDDYLRAGLVRIDADHGDSYAVWACRPEHYPAVVKDVLDGRINLKDNVEVHPLKSMDEIIALAGDHKLGKRVVFVP